ncbi:hypothetical protein DUNSADRAFT_13151 [Dunaliella salina]|uniref:Uncharacterized protein n=1 Tax=Dunaliella salina TaxID=3046 RepID=A0ABZ3KQG8_DUNSA|nr:hypothetical protein DUNSADRAFT_13151 [Dunaliella salina]|eukprot:KAF5831416.1 hypothetical protein DUNSADRAFT_13151 [Dunaliella salina]
MFENFLTASAAAAGQPPEEEPFQDSPQKRDSSPQPPSHAHARPPHHRSVSEQQHQHQHQAQLDKAGGSYPPSRVPSDAPQVLGDSDEGGMPEPPPPQQHTSHAPDLPARPQRKPQSKTERKAEEGMSVAFEEFEDQPARNGVYCQILGEQVEVIGEKGTKVPDINVKELMIEIELVANTLLEWTPAEGWKEGRPVSLKVLQLEHKMRGNLMNLPQSAIKGLLHLFLPSYLGKAIVASLPPELGQYVVEANEDVHLSGELRLFGQALGTYMADVIPPMVNEALSKKKQQQQQQAAARSRGLLGLSEQQSQAVHKIFSVLSTLIPNTGMVSSNKENKSAPVGGVASICQMCRFYLTYSTSRYWSPLCAVWNRAFQAALLFYGVPEEERLSFSQFMDVRVARLVRKPVRVSFMIDRLQMGVDVDAALNSLKELFARLAKDYHRRSLGHPSLHGVDGPVAPREPLEVQLENLELWHASMLAGLRSFKSRFRSASCTLMAMADRDEFQFGAENAAYDGPLHFSVPMNFSLDPDNSFVMDVKLPDQKATMNSVTAIIQVSSARLEMARDGGSDRP